MSKLKIPLIVGITGFVLSLGIGLISGVTVFSLLLRAVVTALVLSGLVVLARMLIEKMIPDLFEVQSDSEEETAEQKGSQVDISIDDEGTSPASSETVATPSFKKMSYAQAHEGSVATEEDSQDMPLVDDFMPADAMHTEEPSHHMSGVTSTPVSGGSTSDVSTSLQPPLPQTHAMAKTIQTLLKEDT